jgi:two-component sensor histidine kinase
MREVSHREKNLLSLVMAVAHQTAIATPEHFLERFSDRLQSMAVNLDLLVKNQWQGIEMAALVRSHLAPFHEVLDTRIFIGGPVLRIGANAAQILGMAVHELTTNALKYGALSNNTGKVEIAWSVHDDAAGPRFTISWVEVDGPQVEPPTRQGFGSTVTCRMPRYGLAADVTLEYPSTGLRWCLACPASKVLEQSSN